MPAEHSQRPEEDGAGNDRRILGARRNSDETFHELCTYLVWHGRTRLVNDTLETRLRTLDESAWHYVRGLSIGSVPIPFVLFGPVGVWLLQASHGYWSTRDIADMCRAADTLRGALKGYPDPVHAAIVVLAEELEPRQHFAGGGEGPCWILGEEMLPSWLYSFHDRGLSREDVAVLRAWGSPTRSCEPRRLFTPANAADGLS